MIGAHDWRLLVLRRAHTAPQALLSHKVFLPAYSSSRLGTPFLCQERNRDSQLRCGAPFVGVVGEPIALAFARKAALPFFCFPISHTTLQKDATLIICFIPSDGIDIGHESISSDLLGPLCSVSSKVTTGFCNRLGLRRRPDEHTVFIYRRNSGAPGHCAVNYVRRRCLHRSAATSCLSHHIGMRMGSTLIYLEHPKFSSVSLTCLGWYRSRYAWDP